MAEQEKITFNADTFESQLMTQMNREMATIKVTSDKKRATSFEALLIVSVADNDTILITDADDNCHSIRDSYYDHLKLIEKIITKLRECVSDAIVKNDVVIVFDQSLYDFFKRAKIDGNFSSSWYCLLM